MHKSFSAETKVLDPTKGLVDCLFSVTSVVDRQGDKILPGAFTKALSAKQSVPVVYGHDWSRLEAVLGKTVSWRELMPYSSDLPPNLASKGYGAVRATVQFDQETPSGRLALTNVKNGNVTSWSFAFDSNKSLEKYDDKGVREIREIPEIFEIGPVLIGANQEAMTLAVKKTMEMQRESAINPHVAIQTGANAVSSKAHLVSKVRGLVAQIERDEPASAKKTAVLAAAKVLLADEDAERDDWARIFGYVRGLN